MSEQPKVSELVQQVQMAFEILKGVTSVDSDVDADNGRMAIDALSGVLQQGIASGEISGLWRGQIEVEITFVERKIKRYMDARKAGIKTRDEERADEVRLQREAEERSQRFTERRAAIDKLIAANAESSKAGTEAMKRSQAHSRSAAEKLMPRAAEYAKAASEILARVSPEVKARSHGVKK